MGDGGRGQITNVFVTNDPAHPVPVHEQGTANVQGTVSSRPVAPASPFKYDLHIQAGDSQPLIGPGSSPIELTSLTVSAGASFSFTLWEQFVPNTATDCHLVSATGVWGITNASAPVTVAFPTPFQLAAPAGQKVCLLGQAYATTASEAEVALSGFLGT